MCVREMTRREARLRVVLHRERGVALDRNVVGVVDDHEAAEAERAREGARLVRNPLLHVAVAAEDPGAVAGGLHLRRQGKADAHCQALPERTRRHLDAADELALGMTRRPGAELAEVLHFVERKPVHAREVEERIDERTAMTA